MMPRVWITLVINSGGVSTSMHLLLMIWPRMCEL